MTRLAILPLLAVLAMPACKKTKQEPTITGPAPLAKRMSLSWGITQNADAADLFLAITDERGQQVSHPIGTFPGTCASITPAPEMNALMAVGCTAGATGTQIQAIVRRDQVLIMKLRTDDGVAPDAMAREEVTQISAPPGAKIEAGQ